jgi:hypothetical protein
MTYNELVEKILKICPDAIFYEEDGQIFIETGLEQRDAADDAPLHSHYENRPRMRTDQ